MAVIRRRRRIVRPLSLPPPKGKRELKYTCDACHGTVSVAHGRQTIEAVRAVHEASCPAVLRLAHKRK